MIKRRFVAKDSRRAMTMIQNTFGPNAIIFSNRKVPEGVEIIAGLEEQIPMPETIEGPLKSPGEIMDREEKIEPYIHESNAAPIESNKISRLEQELSLLKSLLEGQVVHSLTQHMQDAKPKQTLLKQRLISLGLDPELAQKITTPLPEDISIIEGWEMIRSHLLSSIKVSSQEIIQDKKVIALVGSTGVGKTTTVAKMATRYVLQNHPDDLALITTDFNRVAAQSQLLLYGQILGVETYTVHREEDLKQTFSELHKKKLIIIDTAGVSQRDNINIARLFSIFNQKNRFIDAYLTLSCTTQPAVLEETIQAFQSPCLAGCILTKADEALSLVPALSLMIKHSLSIAYITHGQRIPQDIRLALGPDLAECILNAQPLDHEFVMTESKTDELIN